MIHIGFMLRRAVRQKEIAYNCSLQHVIASRQIALLMMTLQISVSSVCHHHPDNNLAHLLVAIRLHALGLAGSEGLGMIPSGEEFYRSSELNEQNYADYYKTSLMRSMAWVSQESFRTCRKAF